jgi:arylsulfatase A-like enzyme
MRPRGKSAKHMIAAGRCTTYWLVSGRRVWAGSFFRWWTCLTFGYWVFDVINQIQQWSDYRTVSEIVNDIAVRILVTTLAAAAVSSIVTFIWLGIAAVSRTPGRSKRLVRNADTAVAAIAMGLLFACYGGIPWLRKAGGNILVQGHPSRFAAAVLVVVLAVVGAAVVRKWLRDRSLRALSKSLEDPARRTVVVAAAGALGVAVTNGVGVRWSNTLPAANIDKQVRRRPNILLITFDALSRSNMSLYGYGRRTTPHMERFASDAILFDNYYSSSNFTTSSVASLLSGLNVPTHRVFEFAASFPEALRGHNIARLLKQCGYQTGAVVANRGAHPLQLGLDRDFDFLPPPARRWYGVTRPFYHLTGTSFGPGLEADVEQLINTSAAALPAEFEATDCPPELAFEAARKFLAAADGPWFLWIHSLVPHAPYLPPSPFLGRFMPGDEYSTRREQAHFAASINAKMDTLQLDYGKLRARYDEFIAYGDHELGTFLADFDASSHAKNAVTVISADHGESFDHGFWGHGGFEMWQDVVGIPLIVRLPEKAHAGRIVKQAASEVDFLPTIMDLVGAPTPHWAEGLSLRPLWESGEGDPRRCCSIYAEGNSAAPIKSGMVAVIDGSFKYIMRVGADTEMMFDLAKDPHERNNICSREPELAKALRTAGLRALHRG